jgi:phytoene dehydrogenase-like protein
MGLAPADPGAWGVTESELASGSYGESEIYKRRKEEYAARMFRTAERVFPGLREHVVFEEVATPFTHSRYTLSTGGTSYGLALIPEQFLWKRPGPKTEIDGLYLCGASTYMGHGIAGAMLSGVNAAAAILGRSVWAETMGGKRVSSATAAPSDSTQPTTRSPAATTVRTGFQPNA